MKASKLIQLIQTQCQRHEHDFQVITDTLNTNLEIKIVSDKNSNTNYLIIKNKQKPLDVIVERKEETNA